MLNLIVTICNDYKICLHLDATSEGVVLQPDVPPYKQMQLFIGPLYNLMQPVMRRCNQWWGDATSDGATKDATRDEEMQPVMGPHFTQMQPVMGMLHN